MNSSQFTEVKPSKTKGVVPLSKDVMYKAQKMFPGYDAQQALLLYMANETDKQEKTDSMQNQQMVLQKRQIDGQKSENEKLKIALSTLGKELQDHERQAAETDREVERLKQLSAKLRPAGEITQQAAKVAADDLQRLEAEVAQIKSKPGMDSAKFNELAGQVKQLKDSPNFDNKELAKVQAALNSLSNKNEVSDQMFDKVMGELEKTKQSLDAKEERFKGYIEKKGKEAEERTKSTAQELAKYAQIVDTYKDKIEGFGGEFEKIRSELLDKLQDVEDKYEYLTVQREIPTIPSQEKDIQQPELPGINQSEPEQSELFGISNTQQSDDDTKDDGTKDDDTDTKNPFAKMSQQFDPKKQEKYYTLGSEQQKAGAGQMALDAIRKAQKQAGSKEVTNEMTDSIGPARRYADPEFEKFLKQNLPYWVKMFKGRYYTQLKNKDPKYSDQQIAYALEEFAPWLFEKMKEWQERKIPITFELVEPFIRASKVHLFRQPVEDYSQYGEKDVPLKEGLDKIYETMLDKIINETLYKKSI